MHTPGVSDISIYVPQFYLPHETLAEARSVAKEKFTKGLGNNNMSILPRYEDTVTMASNAAFRLLEKSQIHPGEIRQLVVSTESGVDHSKPIASFVQGLLKIGSRCRVYEIKHACYGGTAGLINTINQISVMKSKDYKAIVIMADIAKYGFESPGEPTQGAGAVALLVDNQSDLFSVDTVMNGIFSKNVFDFWRPSDHQFPIVDGHYSIECYLLALKETIFHFRENSGFEVGEIFKHVDYLVYHLPFTGMAKKAHKVFVDLEFPDLNEEQRNEIYQVSFSKKVAPGLLGSQEVGNIYTGSVYMSLTSILETEKQKAEGKKIGLFSYGSGCGAEFMICNMNSNITQIINHLEFDAQLGRRKKITFDQYCELYSPSCRKKQYRLEEATQFKDDYTKFVFAGFDGHKRIYI